jgi:hypothetical protein
MSPSCPNSMNASTFGNIHDEIDIGIVVIIRTSRNFDIAVSHANVFRVDLEIIRGSHDCEFDFAFASKCFIAPLSD